jgi:hypothetical protein
MVNPEEKRMIMPDIMLYTKNVMIPLIKPVPVKKNFNIPFPKNKPQIMWAPNYKNNPALLFFERSSNAFDSPLKNLVKVNRSISLYFEKCKNASFFAFLTCLSYVLHTEFMYYILKGIKRFYVRVSIFIYRNYR